MDARIRGTATSILPEFAERAGGNRRRSLLNRPPDFDREIPAPLSGLRIALVHDWLTGIAGARSASRCSAARFPTPSFIP